GNYA
ncbi:enterobacterial Ail/Lom family protein, partial [Escherichia coli 93.0056]